MGGLRFIPPPILYSLVFFSGVFFAVLFPLENQKNQQDFQLAQKQWVLNLGSSWFRLQPKKAEKHSALVFVQVDQKDILCRYPVSALRMFSHHSAVSIDVFIPKIHDKMISLIAQGDHKHHQFVLEDQAQNTPLCTPQGPEIAYGKIR